MKTLLSYLIFLITAPLLLTAQIPSNYYSGTEGLTGFALKTKLHQIISNGHTDQGYGSLYDGYVNTDSDYYYENDGSVLDMYSERPNQSDPYNYSHGVETCGNYNDEGDCYNREHIIPQSVFDEAYPMKSDIHFVVPSDGYVNNRRSSYPFGEVNNPSWVSENGSKLGSNVSGGYTGTVFEPIDAFKGDIARMIFYVATRYEDQIGEWNNFDMFDGSQHKVFTDWALELLMQWHQNDPVSQREIDRNEAAYNYQGNANPFIDHPEWVEMIWDPDFAVADYGAESVSMYPNPARDVVHVENGTSIDRIAVFNLLGEKMYEAQPGKEHVVLTVKNWIPGTYFVRIDDRSGSNTLKLIVKK